MAKKWKIFGVQTDVEWYDIKTKLKKLLRGLFYSRLFQELISLLVFSYMKLVFHSSRKKFVNYEKLFDSAKNKVPLIFVFWHNRLMMIPFVTEKPKKLYPDYNFMTLASKHGDGQFVDKVMKKFGLISISGSSQNGRKSSRGISFSTIKEILKGLGQGFSLGITPDGPRGPNQKINGEVISIARISGAKILPISYSSSRFKKLKTWDQFTIPLPFSTLCFYFDETAIEVNKDADSEQIEKIKNLVEERMNFVQQKSQELV